MAVSVDVDGLEELDEIGDEVVLVDLALGRVELLHEVDEGGQLEAVGVEFELFLKDLHVFLCEDGHDPLHVFLGVPFFLEDLSVEVAILDEVLDSSEAHLY